MCETQTKNINEVSNANREIFSFEQAVLREKIRFR